MNSATRNRARLNMVLLLNSLHRGDSPGAAVPSLKPPNTLGGDVVERTVFAIEAANVVQLDHDLVDDRRVGDLLAGQYRSHAADVDHSRVVDFVENEPPRADPIAV